MENSTQSTTPAVTPGHLSGAAQRLMQLGKDSLIYGFGAIAAKSIGIFVLPIYTRIFSPKDYGTIEMLGLTASLLTALLVMGLDTAQSFYFFKEKDRGKGSQAAVITSILQWRLTVGVAIVICATLSAPLLNALLFQGELSWPYFALAFSGSLFSCVMGQSVQIFRLLYRPWPFILMTLSHTLLAVFVVLILVLAFDRGIISFFIGSASASIIVACIAWYLVRDYLDLRRLHTEWWPTLMRFGAPLVPAGLAMYGMNTSGRWFLQYFHGPDSLGVYAIGARFALLLAIGVETFRKAWWPIAMESMHSDDGPSTFRMIARLYLGLGIAAIVLLTAASPWLVKWLTGPQFHGAWTVVGILCWQSLFYGLYLVASAGIFKAEKTYLNTYLMGGAVVINILLNIALVPTYAGMGAALATSITFFVWISASVAVSERYWRIDFRYGVVAAQLIFGVVVVSWIISTQVYLPPVVNVTVAVIAATVSCYFAVDRKQWSAMLKARR
jgi:O-antigen/teichoic acid export membrane protein